MKKLNILFILIVSCLLCGCKHTTNDIHIADNEPIIQYATTTTQSESNELTTSDITESAYAIWTEFPKYTGTPYVIISNNMPRFSDEDITTNAFEHYSELDDLGRCGIAYANICQELMPTTEREGIGQIKPSGWHTANYHELIDGNYLYNRCHLIGFQLAGENANEKNLITGTRYLNVEGMLPFENQVAEYVKATNHHVLYRVSPVFFQNELVCRGVLIEAESVEDDNCVFCVYCFNVQPGIEINYETGESQIADNKTNIKTNTQTTSSVATYILNTNSLKIHTPTCSAIQDMAQHNRKEYNGDINNLLNQGYTKCKICNPN